MTDLLKTVKQAVGMQTSDAPAVDPASDPTRRNLAVVLAGKESVEVKDIGYPKLGQTRTHAMSRWPASCA